MNLLTSIDISLFLPYISSNNFIPLAIRFRKVVCFFLCSLMSEVKIGWQEYKHFNEVDINDVRAATIIKESSLLRFSILKEHLQRKHTFYFNISNHE